MGVFRQIGKGFLDDDVLACFHFCVCLVLVSLSGNDEKVIYFHLPRKIKVIYFHNPPFS